MLLDLASVSNDAIEIARRTRMPLMLGYRVDPVGNWRGTRFDPRTFKMIRRISGGLLHVRA